MTLKEGEQLAPASVDVNPNSPHTFMLTLQQGLNRQIRRMCRDLGLTILALRRVRIGPLHLGTLGKGECRLLRSDELAALRRAVGLKG